MPLSIELLIMSYFLEKILPKMTNFVRPGLISQSCCRDYSHAGSRSIISGEKTCLYVAF